MEVGVALAEDARYAGCGKCVKDPGGAFLHDYIPEKHLPVYLDFSMADDDFEGDALYSKKHPKKDADIGFKSHVRDDPAKIRRLIELLLPHVEADNMGEFTANLT